MSAKFSAALPNGEANGLNRIVSELVNQPHKVHAVIALIDCKKLSIDNDSGDTVPTARIRRIEVITGADKIELRRLLDRAYEDRSGQTVLPLDLEKDLRAAFEGLDIDTGEIPPGAPDGEQ